MKKLLVEQCDVFLCFFSKGWGLGGGGCFLVGGCYFVVICA